MISLEMNMMGLSITVLSACVWGYFSWEIMCSISTRTQLVPPKIYRKFNSEIEQVVIEVLLTIVFHWKSPYIFHGPLPFPFCCPSKLKEFVVSSVPTPLIAQFSPKME